MSEPVECSPDHHTPAGGENLPWIEIIDNQHKNCFTIRAQDPSEDGADVIHFCDWPALKAAIDQHQSQRGGDLPSPDAALVVELGRTLGERTRWAERLAKDIRAQTAEVIAGLTTERHAMTVVAGLPECACRYPLGGGNASGSFITHALAELAKERQP